MNWKRLSILTSAAMLTGLLCVGAAQAAVVDKTPPYTGEYFLAYNNRSSYSSTDSNSGIMPTSLYDEEGAETEPDEGDVIHVYTNEEGHLIYQVEPRNLSERISAPDPGIQIYSARAEEPPQYGDERLFWTVDVRTNKPEKTLFSLRYCGENCNIWLEKDDKRGITDEMVTELGAEYDYAIHHPVQEAFGEAYDRNGDGKMAIFLYDIQDGYDGISEFTYTGGFFMSADLTRHDLNNMDVIHIDTYPSIRNGDLSAAKSTMVHELQHLIEASACIEPDPSELSQVRRKYYELPLWINEGLSMAAEHMFYGTLTDRIKYYNSNRYQINTPLADWSTGDELSHYSLSYLFIQYLRTQTKDFTGGGEELYKYIIHSPQRSGRCIESAMKQFYPYISLDDIFRNFYIAMVLKEPAGLYGFAGEPAFDPIVPKIYGDTSSLYLGPGAGVVSRMSSGSYTPTGVSGSTVRYAGFKASAGTEVDSPQVDLAGGETYQFRNLNLSCAERYATMYYTVDGSTPTAENGLIYSGKPIQLLSDTNLKAVTITPDGRTSTVTSSQYTIVKEDVDLFRRTVGADYRITHLGSAAAPDGSGIVVVGAVHNDALGGGDLYDTPSFSDKGSTRLGYIAKYGYDGQQQWLQTFSATYDIYLNGVTAVDDGYVAAGNYTYAKTHDGDLMGIPMGGSPYPDNDMNSGGVVVKYNLEGTRQWVQTIPTFLIKPDGFSRVHNSTHIYRVVPCPDGSVVCVGVANTSNDIGMDNNGVYTNIYGRAVIAKVSADGEILWRKEVSGGGIDCFRDACVLKDGTIVAVGYMGGASFGNGDWSETPKPAGDVTKQCDGLVAAYTQEGELLWKTTFNQDLEDVFRCVTPVYGGFVAGGSTCGSNDIDRGLLACFNSDGTFRWNEELSAIPDGYTGGSRSNYGLFFSGLATADNGIGIMASVTNIYDNNFTGDLSDLTPISDNDNIVVKYDMNGYLGWKKNYNSNYGGQWGNLQAYTMTYLGDRQYAVAGRARMMDSSMDNHAFLFTFYDESIPYCTVSGNVGLPGVSIGGKLSDSQGNYSVRVMQYDGIVLEPKLAGYTFEPAKIQVFTEEADVPNQDFTPHELKYTVSGTILDPDGKPLPGVSVGGTTTGADGKYSIQVRPGVNVVLTPALEGMTFEPASRTITGISENTPNQNFRVPRPKFKVSGTVTRNGVGQGNVLVGGVLTDESGHYEITVEQGTDLTLAPMFFRYAFTPAEIPLKNISADTPNQNFTMDLTSAVFLTAPQSLDLGTVTVGYDPVKARSVTVHNDGYIACSGLRAELAKDSCFVLDVSSLSDAIAAGGSATFTIKPKDGLAVGSYSENITVTDGDNTLTIAVTFEVKAADKPENPDNPDPDKPDPDKPGPDKPDPDNPDPDKPGPDKPDPDNPDPDKPGPDKPDPDKPDPDNPDPDKPDPDNPDPDKPDPDIPDDPGGDDGGDDDDDDPPSGGNSGGSSGGTSSSRPSKPAKPATSPTQEPAVSQKPAQTVDHTPYVNGYEDGAFLPEANLTRGQCTAILSRLMGGFEPERDYGKLPFPDVREDAWYYNHIAYMTTRGFIKGYPDGTFRPDAPISRAEFSILVRNALRLENTSACSFPDVQAHWAIDPIGQLTQAGILDGYPDGTFRPDAPISRAEAVKVLNGAYRRSPVQSDFDRLEAPFTDLYPSHWAYYDILEAALEHKHTVK